MVSLDSTCKVEVFSSEINPDRYHLLKFNDNIEVQDIIYVEEGSAFNGFYNPLVLNCSADLISDSRLLALTIYNVESGHRVFYLITNVEYLRNNKCLVYTEYDVWMNCRGKIKFGYQNDLFKCSEVLTNYPYSDIPCNYYTYQYVQDLLSSVNINYIVLYHNSEYDVDEVYTIEIDKESVTANLRGSETCLLILRDIGLDVNQIVSIYVSPFDLNINTGTSISTTWPDTSVYRNTIDSLVQHFQLSPLYFTLPLTYSPYFKMVITDANGMNVWQNNRQMVGEVSCYMFLEMDFNSCNWFGYIETNLPDRRFTISCPSLPFFTDYFQQYMNLQREYNLTMRHAQLEKQLIDGIGDVSASTLWHGTSSGMTQDPKTGAMSLPATSGIATAGAAVGGSLQILANTYSSVEYYKKLNNEEVKQASIQYDVMGSAENSATKFLWGYTSPALYFLNIDIFNYYANLQYHSVIPVGLNYNCHIHGEDLYNLIRASRSIYISGDFDILGIGEKYAKMLNARFNHGINFVTWKN